MTDYSQHTRTRKTMTPQTEPMPGRAGEQVTNSAGGVTFALDRWHTLTRFLILGSEGGTYYTGERDLTQDNHENLLACVQENAQAVLDLLVDISIKNRAPKNEAAIYALAVTAAFSPTVEGRRAAFAALPRVCRIGTHLFSFAQYYTAFRGWSRMARTGIAGWYGDRSHASLAHQLLKYKQRNGWSHGDLIRLAHPRPLDQEQRELFGWAVTGVIPPSNFPEAKRITALARLHVPEVTEKDVIQAVTLHDATFEMIPSQSLKSPRVWAVLLPQMGAHALMRNLGRMTAIGMTEKTADEVLRKLGDHQWMRSNKVHPLNVMVTLAAYSAGYGQLSSLAWEPNQRIIVALERALEASFQWVEPTGKRLMIGLDVSGSMSSSVAGMTGVSCRMAESVLALMYVRSEPYAQIVAFDHVIQTLPFNYTTSLTDAMRMARRWEGGSTDLAAPIAYAVRHRVRVDAFILFTDNETWAGKTGHPVEWMAKYRAEINPDTKLIVCGMTATQFTIADPKDAGMLDIVGMDTSVPAVIAATLRNTLK